MTTSTTPTIEPSITRASPPLAIRHILERRDARDHDTPRKLGLVVQGGSMRGIFTAGALCGLEELGLRDCFDHVYGASGGAINAAYFLAGQVAYGTSIYYCNINNSRFINFQPHRVLGGNAMDIDYCFDDVIRQRKRLDLTRILSHRSRFKVFVTDPALSLPVAFEQQGIESETELLAVLKASAAMPLVYRRRVMIRGRWYVDGAFLEPVPLAEAVADGCTDVLALLSRPLSWHPVGLATWARYLIHRHIRPSNMAASETAWRAGQNRLEAALDQLQGAAPIENGQRTVNVAYVAPPHDFPLNRWSKDRDKLVQAATGGAALAFDLFGEAAAELDPREAIRSASFRE